MREPHPLAGKTVRLKATHPSTRFGGRLFEVEDYWQNVGDGSSWMRDSASNPACLQYAIRGHSAELPLDNEVVYGKIGAFGYLVHVSELGDVVDQDEPRDVSG